MFRRKQPIPTDTPLGRCLVSMLKHCEGLGYRGEGLEKIRAVCQTLIELASQTPQQTDLSDELLTRIRAKYKIPIDEAEGAWNAWQQHIGRCIRMIQEFVVRGCFQRKRKVVEKTLLPAAFGELLRGYEEYAQKTLGVRPSTMERRSQNIAEFLHFLDARTGPSVERITPAQLTDFVSSRAHIHPSWLAKKISDLRTFLRYLCVRGAVEKDLSGELPRIRIPKDAHIPSVWKSEDVAKLLAAVDRSSPMGKRDYAILLLAAHLGLRAGDIRALKLEQIDWDRGRIDLCQSKTSAPLSLPLTEEIGQAIIDYLRHGRPKMAHREVFLLARAPFGPFESTSLSNIMRFWRRKAGLHVTQQRGRQGLHSLRHTLATRLLQVGTPLGTIANIIGHLSWESTRIYAKADVATLQSLAIDPEEVWHDA
jgi:site-specific recombinase XerD